MITIGMPSYDNPDQVWFTVQALRLYQDVVGCEILILDNQGNSETKDVADSCKVRYEEYSDIPGTAPARNKIFELAKNPFVLIMDSHVMLVQGAISALKWWLMNNWDEAVNLLQGPIVMSNLENSFTHYDNKWRKEMWGIWPAAVDPNKIQAEPFEIEMMGLGLFGCRKDSWLGFHPDCKGFDGVEGVIHEKYRRAGRKVLCLPFMKWIHKFGRSGNFPLDQNDKIRNFILGFEEIGMDLGPVYEHFGKDKVTRIRRAMEEGKC
jgi:hypothetical protein